MRRSNHKRNHRDEEKEDRTVRHRKEPQALITLPRDLLASLLSYFGDEDAVSFLKTGTTLYKNPVMIQRFKIDKLLLYSTYQGISPQFRNAVKYIGMDQDVPLLPGDLSLSLQRLSFTI